MTGVDILNIILLAVGGLAALGLAVWAAVAVAFAIRWMRWRGRRQ